jgi:hypothetical protein
MFMVGKPHAFLSYTRIDDEFYGGAITELRKRLELGVRVATGDRGFTIFQDVEGIEFGQHWPSRLEEALAEARFLIPILTPSFFTSKPCREELEKFLELEAKASRNDLILPIYFISTPYLRMPSGNGQIISRKCLVSGSDGIGAKRRSYERATRGFDVRS